ncbi:hypothetical protein LPB142_05225 [Rhodobacter xanthinilyticus]|uniref:TraB/GumN family protein n=1 Tax=Rhodobacter xanthinilyticus TaxID=1850250 RepID=A0A1D9MA98_9RHOB|nr:TraB/GumN family protein [Rhodobacter xanthinilyticus]AOZ68792.1 hypothetical protein LPB142_05225 [Rhodobacter xanthinilyticus]
MIWRAVASVALGVSVLAGTGARAGCVGTDLFAALPEAERAALTADAAAAPHGEGLVFRASRGEERLTVVGTYHLPDPRHAALVAEIRPDLAAATTLLVEAGPEEEAALKARIATDPGLMFATDGPTLPEILPEDLWQELATVATARGMPAVLVAKMRPAFLSMILSIPPCALTEMAEGGGGLDKALMAEAAARDLPVRAVEPYDTLFTLFEEIPQEDTEAMIRATLVGAEDGPSNSVTMGNLYFARQPRLIWEFSRHEALAAGLDPEEVAAQMDLAEELLVVRRNRAWIAPVEAALAEGPAVLAVGALHLSGAVGVLALLEAEGFTVTRVD